MGKNMDWIMDTTKGCFQGSRLKEIISNMVEYYGIRDEEPDRITNILAFKKNDHVREICENGVAKIQDYIEEMVARWRQVADQEKQGIREIESDFRADLL